VIIAGILSVHKNYTDFFYNNSYISQILEMSLQEINQIELDFLSGLDFGVTVY